MKKLKRIAASIIAMYMLIGTAFAETDTITYKAKMENGEVTIEEKDLTGVIDNSNLEVNVIKQQGNTKTTVFTGKLKDYDNGHWVNIDFSEIQFLLIFNWETIENESICIIPANSTISCSNVQQKKFKALQVDSDEFFRLENALDVEDTSGDIPKKIYNVDLLPSEYLDYMSELGSETGNYGDGSVPAPAVSYDYDITKINLRDDEDNSVNHLVNGGVLQSVTVESNGVDDDVILAVAEYNGYTLTKLTSYNITLTNNRDVVMTNYALSNITEDTSIKLFVWDAYWGTTPKANPITMFTENDMDISLNFMYDNAYTEKVFNRDKTFSAQVNVKSTKWWPQDVSLYVALYDENNKLVSIANKNSNIISNGKYQFIDVGLPLAQDLPNGYTVKTFVWENQSMKPYLANETVASIDDYHSDNVSDARLINISNAVKGIINTDTDKDCVKFIPTSTQDYLIQLSGSEDLKMKLYDSRGNVITTTDFYSSSTGTIIEQSLTKGKVYSIEISGAAQDEYSLTITPNTKANDNLFVTGRGIDADGQAAAAQELNAKLLSETGVLISAQECTTDENGNYTVNLPINLSNGEYYFVVSNVNVVQKLWKINALVNNCSFDKLKDEYCIVPVTLSNADKLENINFSVSYADTDFELYDACDMTETIENTATKISDKSLDIVNVQPSYIVFKSLKTEEIGNNELINIVKLKSKQNAASDISVCAYTIQ